MGVDPARITVGLGSDQLISVLTQIFVDPEDTVVVPRPSFEMYAAGAHIAGGRIEAVGLREENDFALDPDEFIAAAARTRAKVIYVCTPNNPTGGMMPAADIARIAQACPESLVVADEAYIEFADAAGGATVTAAGLTAAHENLVVLRTFSKAWGLAGLRCGYAIAGEKVTKLINAVKPPYNVPTFTQKCAGALLDASEDILARADAVRTERGRLAAGLRGAGMPEIKVYPSLANFLLVRFAGLRGTAVREALAERGVLVRAFAGTPELERCVRITVGTSEQNDLLLSELAEVCRTL